jgi:hypothetical protein
LLASFVARLARALDGAAIYTSTTHAPARGEQVSPGSERAEDLLASFVARLARALDRAAIYVDDALTCKGRASITRLRGVSRGERRNGGSERRNEKGQKKVPPMGIQLEDLRKVKVVPHTGSKTDSNEMKRKEPKTVARMGILHLDKMKRKGPGTVPLMAIHLEDLTRESAAKLAPEKAAKTVPPMAIHLEDLTRESAAKLAPEKAAKTVPPMAIHLDELTRESAAKLAPEKAAKTVSEMAPPECKNCQ